MEQRKSSVESTLALLKASGLKHGAAPEPAPAKPVDVPACPPELSAEARAEWERLAPLMVKKRLLTTFDTTAFGLYCSAYGEWVVAERALRAEQAQSGQPFLVPATDGSPHMVQSPWLAILRRARVDANRYLRNLGLSPTTRKSMLADTREDPEDEARWARLDAAMRAIGR